MKPYRFVFLIAITFLLVNCSKDETPEPKTDAEEQSKPKPEEPESVQNEIYFTYSGSASSEAHHWIIIHDSEGNLIDFKKAEYGEVLQFLASKESIPEKISITEFIYFKGFENSLNHRLYTHTDIEPGSVRYTIYDYQLPVKIGTFDLRIKNIPGLNSHTIFIEGSPVNVGESNAEDNSTSTDLDLKEATLYGNEEYMLSIYDKSGNHKYLAFPSPDDKSDLVFDYSEFNDYDSYLEITLPADNSVSLYTHGYTGDNPNYNFFGQALSNYRGIEYSEKVKAGYLNKYDKFKTEFNITLEGSCFYNFIKTGDKIESLQIPTRPNYFLSDSTVYDLKVTTDLTLSSKKSTHNYTLKNENGGDIHTQWSVYSDGSNSHKVGQLPQEILTEYPSLSLEKLKIFQVTLFAQGYTPQQIFDQLTSKEKKGDKVVESYLYLH